ncbi:S-adenosyl-L-methionine-dependent methyltransferase superfamily protein [Abeliophyllum distichum]|uniref:tRNA N(3)-methylcytidine methyltransferase n=1 Tax=Abeliophyllum distichum TaxID=126358 RepID=A0ABD1VP54_9LAMI
MSSSSNFMMGSIPIAAVDRRNCCQLPTIRVGSLTSAEYVNDNSEHYFCRKSVSCWDKFYKRHQNKFFKDRHYLEKDWGKYFSDTDDDVNAKVLLEVGCGAGNSIFPLIAAYPKLFVHACDFSSQAVTLVKSHSNFTEDRINVFLCDAANDDLAETVLPSSVDVVTLIFMLSAVSPNKMLLVVQNLKKVLKPNGHILLRDYAVGDSAQVNLENKNQMISDNFYFRGDGTCSFYFSEDFLSSLFVRAGFNMVDINTYCRQMENRLHNITVQRRWIRAIFSKP